MASYEQFVAAYPREVRAPREDGRHADLMTAPAEIAIELGRLTHDHLSGAGVTDVELQTATTRLYAWWKLDFADAIHALYDEETGSAPSYERMFHFHSLAGRTLLLWGVLATEETIRWKSLPVALRRHVDRLDGEKILFNAQLGIAHHALNMMKAREARVARNGHRDPGDTLVRGVQAGMLAESDAAIVLLEIMNRVDGLWVLPAAPQFEAATRRSNADFLVLRPGTRSVCGVQVKTSLHSRRTAARYDERVVIIDSDTDLGNRVPVRLHPRSSNLTTIPWPGLIAAHRIVAAPLGGLGYDAAPLIAKEKHHAERLTQKTKDDLDKAVDRILPRIHAALDRGDDPPLPDAAGARRVE